MKNYDYICRDCNVIFEQPYWQEGDPCPSNPPECTRCGQKTQWYPTCQFQMDPNWGAGQYIKGYGFFDSKEKYDKYLKDTGRLYYEPGMERDAARNLEYQDKKIDEEISKKVGQVVQERVIV